MKKAEAFALRIVRFYQHLSEKGERVMSKQVLRSGTSIGANITEGHYGASKADFINKYVIATGANGQIEHSNILNIRTFLYGKIHGKVMNVARQSYYHFLAMGAHMETKAK